MADPFLEIGAFEAEYQGTLSAGERTTAERLLQVASDQIRSLKSDADATAAEQVVFEIVRDAAMFGALERLSKFDNETSRRKESGEFASVVDDYLTKKHKRALGIVTRPAYYFGD